MRQLSREALEIIVGGAVILIAAVFIGLGASGGVAAPGPSGVMVTAQFGSVGPLQSGADVRVGGVRVGSVSGMALDPESFRATVSMSLEPGIALPADSSAKILTDGLLGDAYVALVVGGALETFEDGMEIGFTQDAVNVIDLVSRLIASGVEYEMQQQGLE